MWRSKECDRAAAGARPCRRLFPRCHARRASARRSFYPGAAFYPSLREIEFDCDTVRITNEDLDGVVAGHDGLAELEARGSQRRPRAVEIHRVKSHMVHIAGALVERLSVGPLHEVQDRLIREIQPVAARRERRAIPHTETQDAHVE